MGNFSYDNPAILESAIRARSLHPPDG